MLILLHHGRGLIILNEFMMHVESILQNIELMNSLSEFLMDNISNLTSYRSIAGKLNDNNINTNDKTIASYIKYLCDAFAFYKIRRYDIQGKKYLSTIFLDFLLLIKELI